MKTDSKIIVAITGASGSVYGLRLIGHLLQAGFSPQIIFSDAGADVMNHEAAILPDEKQILEYFNKNIQSFENRGSLRIYDNSDLFLSPASGSARYDSMIIAPCSMKTVASVANGISSGLIERAADVILKEKKKFIIVPRETPLSSIHLDNMLKIDRAGGIVLPAMPAFYNKPDRVEDLVDFVVGKILSLLNIDHSIYPEWGSER